MKLTMDKIHSCIDDLPNEGIDRIEAYLVTLDVVPDYAALPIKYDELKSYVTIDDLKPGREEPDYAGLVEYDDQIYSVEKDFLNIKNLLIENNMIHSFTGRDGIKRDYVNLIPYYLNDTIGYCVLMNDKFIRYDNVMKYITRNVLIKGVDNLKKFMDEYGDMDSIGYDETFYLKGDGIVTDIDHWTPKFYDKITKKNLDKIYKHDFDRYLEEPYFLIQYSNWASCDRLRALQQMLIFKDKLENSRFGNKN